MSIDTALTISADADVVTVIERFAFGHEDVAAADSNAPTRPTGEVTEWSEQSTAVDIARAVVTAQWPERADFVAAAVLRSREHNRLTVYSQWRPPVVHPAGDGADVPESWSLRTSLASAVSSTEVLDARTFTVAFTDGHTAPTTVSVSGTPILHFGIFTVPEAHQDQLLALGRKYGHESLSTPGLFAINFHRSTDGREVINLGTWRSFEDFEKLLLQPGFADGEVYWAGVADFEPDFYDVVEIGGPRSGRNHLEVDADGHGHEDGG